MAEVLRTVTGDISTLAVLWNPDDPPAVVALKETEDAARALQVELSALAVRRVQDYAPAFGEIGKAQPKGLIILNSAFMTSSVVRIAELALGLKGRGARHSEELNRRLQRIEGLRLG